MSHTLYDKIFYDMLIFQVTNFLENDKNYIHSIESKDLDYSNSYGFTFTLRFMTYSGYSVVINNERNRFDIRYENCDGENVLSNIISYNVKSSEKNIIKAIKLFKLLDIRKKLWVSKWTGQCEITNIDANNHITVIHSNDFEKFQKKNKVGLVKRLFLFMVKKI